RDGHVTGVQTCALPIFAAAPDRAADQFPFPVTRAVLEHGRNRFSIYCVVCHDPQGTGRGPIVLRGYTPPPSFHIDRLRTAPPGRSEERRVGKECGCAGA